MPNDGEVGYGKPPEQTRFTKGRSGNPKGRPKGSKNLATIFKQVTTKKISVKENGRTRNVTRMEAIVSQLTNKALSGDARAVGQLLKLSQLCEASLETLNAKPEIGERDRSAFQNVMKRMNRIVRKETDLADTE
jgi:hypothetical protein